MTGQHPALARALLFVVPALWSTNFLIARLGEGLIGPHALALGRWTVAALLMLPFVWGELVRLRHQWLREWRQMLVLGFLGMYICGAWVYIGGRSTAASNMALIFAATPVSIAAASAWLLHEPLRRPQKLAIALALFGALFVVTRGDPSALLDMRLAAGDGWILAAALAWTGYSVLLRKWPSVLGPSSRLVAVMVGGLVFLVPGTVWEVATAAQPPITWAACGLVVVAAVVPGVASYAAYSWLQNQLGAARTALMLYVAPVYGSLGAWWLLGERPGWHHAVGAALILPSIWLATRREPVNRV